EAGSETASKAPIHSNRAPRIALYSQGMMGFGHIRRNASIAQALRRSALQPAIVMIAEAWQAGALLMPEGIDCVTLPAIRKEAIRKYYDAVWIYGDPTVFDPVREYELNGPIAAKARHVGYLDQRPRLEFARAEAEPFVANLPQGRIVLCLVGGGHDGGALGEAFLGAKLPPDATGVLVAGPLMPWEDRERIRQNAKGRSHFQMFDFVHDPTPLIERADRIIAMGGYNTVCEALSFEKHALIVPRVSPEPEQWIRAQRLRDLGLVDVLHPGALTPEALTEWLASDLGPPPAS